MDLVGLELLPDLGKQHLCLVIRPPTSSRKQSEGIRLEGHLDKLHTEPPPNLLELGILWPRAHGHNLLRKLDILEPGLLEHAGHLGGNVKLERGAEAAELGEPLVRRRVLPEGVVVAEEVGPALGDFDAAAGLAAVVGLGEERGPILDCAGEGAGVDKVELVLGTCPVLGCIVNLELDVGRDPEF